MSRSLVTLLDSSAFRRLAYGVGGLGLLSLAAVGTAAAVTPSGRIISQKGKSFFPSAISIAQGESLTLNNDDTNVVHHAYTEDERFSFDSGDQVPGTSTAVAFPKAGTFTVMCGIHPKMRLTVDVKPTEAR